MPHAFVDCQGLAGGWTLGAVQAGLTLAHRVSQRGGFGDAVVTNNRHLLPGPWCIETDGRDYWTPQTAGFVCGTPPCSGFSNMTAHMGGVDHGVDARVNECMVDLVRYGSQCTGEDGRRGAEVIAFESVQGAYRDGRELMQGLRDRASRFTGERYALHHVLVSGSSLGAAQYRHRYFMVLSRIPIGFAEPRRRHVVTVSDAIGDLAKAGLRWEEQRYPPHLSLTPYQREMRAGSRRLTDHSGCDTASPETMSRSDVSRAEILDMIDRGWRPGEFLYAAFRRLDHFPGRFDQAYVARRWVNAGPRLIDPNNPGHVITGGAARSFVHWSEPRYVTVREGTRLMGYPDTWRWPTRSPLTAFAWIGKCAPVPSCRWLSERVRAALDREPEPAGQVVGLDEYLYEHTHAYQGWGDEARQLPLADLRRWVTDWFPRPA